MSDCCSKSTCSDSFPRKHTCPSNGEQYSSVSTATIRHHIKDPWAWQPKNQGYYFCSAPDCSVVYFGQDNSVIESDSLRTLVGVKSESNDALVCYCYGITNAEANNNPLTRQFVVQEKKSGNCACTARNPSGRCCLANFPKGSNT